jgi:hypothetical protein
MDTTKLTINSESSHGTLLISEHLKNFRDKEEGVYFCYSGLVEVLGTRKFKSISLSLSPMDESVEINVKHRMFHSEHGKYLGCLDHPKLVLELMGVEEETPEEFTFYVKIN